MKSPAASCWHFKAWVKRIRQTNTSIFLIKQLQSFYKNTGDER
jgi:hypothetical protein